MPDFNNYINSFTHLRRATGPMWTPATKNRAPHKPFLLLAILDLFAQGTLETNFIELTPELNDLFNAYWTRILPPDQQSSIAFPFFHLRGENFWHLVPIPGQERELKAVKSVTSVTQIRRLILGARLDDELFALLQEEKARNLLRAALIEAHFSPEARPLLVEQGTINAEAYEFSLELLGDMGPKIMDATPAFLAERKNLYFRPEIRDQGFRRAVVNTYKHRCALCGIRMITFDGHTAVEAVHIVPWSKTHDDRVLNGMALCGLCHWGFDEGMMSVNNSYEIITSRQLFAEKNIPSFLLTLDGRNIIGPEIDHLWPDLRALAWHRKYCFRV